MVKIRQYGQRYDREKGGSDCRILYFVILIVLQCRPLYFDIVQDIFENLKLR